MQEYPALSVHLELEMVWNSSLIGELELEG